MQTVIDVEALVFLEQIPLMIGDTTMGFWLAPLLVLDIYYRYRACSTIIMAMQTHFLNINFQLYDPLKKESSPDSIYNRTLPFGVYLVRHA